MPISYRDGIGIGAKFFGSLTIKDVVGYVNYDFYTAIRDEVITYTESLEAPTALLTKVRPFVRNKFYDETTIKSFGGIPERSQFGTYTYALSGFYHFPEFISLDQQCCLPAYLWITGDSFPELLDMEDATETSLAYGIFEAQGGFGTSNAIVANTAVFNFYQTVIADIQIFYSAVVIPRYLTEGQIGVKFVNI